MDEWFHKKMLTPDFSKSSRSEHDRPWMMVFSGSVCSPLRWQPAPIMQLFVIVTPDDTVLLPSNTFFSPIFVASMVHPTSNTLFDPIKSVGGLAGGSMSSSTLALLIIVAYSSIKQFSPMMIGPASAIIVTRGWIMHPPEMVISPMNVLSSHSQTIAFGIIFKLQRKWRNDKGHCSTSCSKYLLIFCCHFSHGINPFLFFATNMLSIMFTYYVFRCMTYTWDTDTWQQWVWCRRRHLYSRYFDSSHKHSLMQIVRESVSVQWNCIT